MTYHGVAVPMDRVEVFCRKWKIAEFCLFGSILRDDFGPASDVDVLVTFQPDAAWSLLDHARLELELEAMLGRRVQVLTRSAVENSANAIRREAILSTARAIYRAA
ncbi:MAG: nucleotidyltransferase domain-containing protein [Planctomycetota bacterium]|nr:nucleotidyltransferase domain-containing protein [Planctomycetota bacterium]